MDATDRRRRASAEAADWFARLQCGDMRREERGLFVDWLRESPIHVAETLRIARVHGALEQFERWTQLSDAAPVAGGGTVIQLDALRAPVTARPRTFRRAGLFAGAAIAASLAIASLIVVPRLTGQLIETERGERREVVLSDGSIVQVDPETRLRVKYADQMRRVFLERGRALFHVAKSPERPFLVQVDATTVRAVGTAFGVERERESVVVTVVEGKVALGAGAQQSKQTDRPGESALLLTANQQIVVARGGSAGPVRVVDSQSELAWAEGRLIFRKEALGKVIAEFNRYNRIQLDVTDAALAGRPVSGVFNASDPQAFIDFLRTVAPVDIVRDGDDTITIRSVYRESIAAPDAAQ
jgi:transmembrane sensor